MTLFSFFGSGEFYGTYIFGVDKEAFWVAMTLWGALLFSIPVLANRPQPVPNLFRWEWHANEKHWKSMVK